MTEKRLQGKIQFEKSLKFEMNKANWNIFAPLALSVRNFRKSQN